MKHYSNIQELKADERNLTSGDQVYIEEYGFTLTYKVMRERNSYLDTKSGHIILLSKLEENLEKGGNER